MKKLIALFICFTFMFSLVSCSGTSTGDQPSDNVDTKVPAGKTFYVSLDGNDENDGSKENPLASMHGAVEAVRAYKAENGLPDGGIEVLFASGTYQVTSTINLSNDDSGAEGKPIVYRAMDGAEVIFDGGVSLKAEDFVPANDEIKQRIVDDTAREALVQIDLAAAGCYELTQHTNAYGNGWNSHEHNQELFVDNERQTLAKWPNESAYPTNGKLDESTSDSHYNIPEEKYELWKDIENIGYYGAPEIEWDMRHVFPGKVRIDEERKTLVLEGMGFTPSDSSSLWVNNIPEEIDMPGEYWWDIETGILYYYPDGDLSGKKISFSQLAAPFFAPSDTHYLTFEGLTFENFRSPVWFNEGSKFLRNSNFTINNCVFRCMGVNAIGFFCNSTTVTNNVFYEIGSAPMSIRSGEPEDSEWKNTNTIISNNVIHDYSQVYKTNTPGILAEGIGFTISHNEIYNSPTHAIDINAGESIIEYNKIHDVCDSTGDAGAIYLGRRWDWSGNVIRYNYIYDIIDKAHGRGPCAIYLDDQVSGQTIYGNILVNIGGHGFTLGGGKYNTVENNIMVDCGGVPIGNDQRGLGFSYEITIYKEGYLWEKLLATNPHSDIMRLARPYNLLQSEISKISSIYNIDDPGIGSYTTIRGNIAYGCISDGVWVEDSDYGDIYKDTISIDGVSNIVPAMRLYCTTEGNMHYDNLNDIGFNDPDNGDYSIKDSSRIYRDIPGFEKIPFDMIGILK